MRCRGFSLLELLIVMILITILLTAGVPAVGRLAQDARLTADINAFVGAVQLARSESAKRAATVVVCRSADGRVCSGRGTYYDAGWIVFADEDGDSPPAVDAGEPVLLAHMPVVAGTIRSNRGSYAFRPFNRRSTNGTVTFCDARGREAARAVIVSYTGRPRVAAAAPGGRALACPGRADGR